MKNRFSVFLALTILYALLIFILSSSSSLGDPRTILGFFHFENLRSLLKPIENSDLRVLLYPLYIFSEYPDKVGHVVLYAGFGFLLYLTLKNSSNITLKNYAFLFAIIIGTVYGASDELHQSFVPRRTASILDLLADCTGVALAQIIVFVGNRLSTPSTKKNNLDLKLAVILTILSIIFILIPPFNQTFLRIILALPLLLFLPGYLLMAVMFPKRGELSSIERFTLSIGLSIAITVFDGFGLNFTKWGFRPNSIVISLSTIIVLLLLVAYLQRWRLKEAGYGFSFKDITTFYHSIRSKETETGPEYDPALEKTLIKTMVIAILLVSAMLIYAKVTKEPEKFTALYILGANGKAENYPTEIHIGELASVLVGVENYEYAPVNYTLHVNLGGRLLKEQYIVLNHGNKWLNNVTFVPQLTSSIAFAGANKSKLEFQLLKDNQPYREVHLLVNTSLDSVKFAALPNLTNGDMESDDGWIFSRSSPNITGNYTNNTGNSSSRTFEINFTTEVAGYYGTIYQNLTTHGDSRATLSFDVRDSEYSNTSNYTFKQALIDEQVVWESGVGGENSSWEHEEVPVLLSGNNTLAFRVYSKHSTNDNITAWWDNVQLEPFGANKTETKKRPVKKVYEFNFDVRGAPLTLEKSMKIDGFGFPGFNYNITGNKSYEELRLLLSDNNQIDTGNATYTTQVNGSDLYLMGSRYRILGNDITNLSQILDTYPNKTLTLGETWNFGGIYSLSVSLISSKADSAMLVLQKSGSTLDTRLVNRGGIYEYMQYTGQFYVTVFRARIDSISGDNVYLTDIELYSDASTALETGAIMGDFEVNNISSDEIVFKNIYPFELNNRTVILNGSMGLSLQGNLLYPYATGVKIRGTPQYIYYGRWMNITGSNYPGFFMENNTSYEELRMYFSGNGLVETGQAVYRSKKHSGMISFLGNNYELIYPNSPKYITNITTNKKITLYENTTRELDKGFGITFKKENNSNDSIILSIRKNLTEEQKQMINIINESLVNNSAGNAISVGGFYPDIYYEMYTGRNDIIKKSNKLSVGDRFEYWIEYRVDRTYKAIAGELENIDNNSIELNVREYDIPFEIAPGRSFGEFDVESITNDTITLRNTKPLQFMPGEEKTILNGALKIKTSPNDYLAYPSR
jgi:uncharacterized membrane protein